MKLVFSFLLLIAVSSNAQSLADSLGNPGFNLQDSLADKLADLALNNKRVKLADKDINVKKFEVQKNKAAWLNNMSASFNLNEANIKSTGTDQNNIFFPRYNLGLTLPLGFFFSKAKDVQIARGNYEMAEALKEAQVEETREAIKMQYQVYQAGKYLLALHETILQDENVLLKEAEAKFAKNEIGLQAFTDASRRYNAELVKKIGLLKDLNNAKYQLETLIGMPLEDALAKITATAK
ncbi:MAG: TolC family protein [Sphingobacteriales bacterium]|nr:TolC family protein [Sphingobacteriales bacterium]